MSGTTACTFNPFLLVPYLPYCLATIHNFVYPSTCGRPTAHEAQPTLTAALADKGMAEIIGEAEGGWFWLPPWSMWQPWAKEGLERAAKKMALKVTSVLDRPMRKDSVF
jgi:hypothetical protein